MATETVPLFSSLPLEIRRKIYMLATPPRIVHVQEVPEDQEAFEEKFETMPVQLKLDPSLAYFAFNWSRRIHRNTTQKTLESYGITGGKVLHRPWEPSAATPEIPLHWLADKPNAAWQLVREGYLYSKAPIPALLHTCAESRAELISRGYQLAFRTRSNGPRTWFNFERDVLYVDRDDEYEEGYRSLLSGGPWEFGQLHPEDLQRVRKLAMNRSAFPFPLQSPALEPAVTYTSQFSNALRLFPSIKELFLVDWSQKDVGSWSEFSAKESPSPAGNKRSTEYVAVDTPREFWRCVAIEEIDALFWLIAPKEKDRTESFSTGENAQLLKAHKEQNGDIPYFQYYQLQLEQRLLEQRDSIVSGSNDGSVAPWEIPKIKAVHILPSSMATFLSHERQIAWVEFSEMKRRQRELSTLASIIPPAAMTQDTVVPESQLPFGQDDEEAFAEAHEGCCGQCAWGYYQDRFIEDQKKWWIEEGSVPAPVDEIIY
jgi:hypothetical protein